MKITIDFKSVEGEDKEFVIDDTPEQAREVYGQLRYYFKCVENASDETNEMISALKDAYEEMK